MKDLRLELVDGRFAVVKLGPESAVPQWAQAAPGFSAVVRTPGELSILVDEVAVPKVFSGELEKGWRGLFVRGKLEFELVGILAQLAGVLAEEGVAIFVVSTFDTDWLFVKELELERALKALGRRGWLDPKA